jgi:hypothetical protein
MRGMNFKRKTSLWRAAPSLPRSLRQDGELDLRSLIPRPGDKSSKSPPCRTNRDKDGAAATNNCSETTGQPRPPAVSAGFANRLAVP